MGKQAKRKENRGRKPEGRTKVTCYLMPKTHENIKGQMIHEDSTKNTVGKIIDEKFSVN